MIDLIINSNLSESKDKKGIIKKYLESHYSFTYEDLVAFLKSCVTEEGPDAVKRGLINISEKLGPLKVCDIIGFLTVEVYQNRLRFDKPETYCNLDMDKVLEDVER